MFMINGEKESGVTTFLIDDKIDTGGVLLQEKIEILVKIIRDIIN